jgi:hypothetical protein
VVAHEIGQAGQNSDAWGASRLLMGHSSGAIIAGAGQGRAREVELLDRHDVGLARSETYRSPAAI